MHPAQIKKNFTIVYLAACMAASWVMIAKLFWRLMPHVVAFDQPPQEEYVSEMTKMTGIECGQMEVLAVYRTGEYTREAACIRRNFFAEINTIRTGHYASVYTRGGQSLVYCRGEGTSPPIFDSSSTLEAGPILLEDSTVHYNHESGAWLTSGWRFSATSATHFYERREEEGDTQNLVEATYNYGCPGR